MSKEHLRRLLAQNEIDELFRVLRETAQSELILLEGQWHDLKADARAGVLTEEQANVEEARIRRRLLELIEGPGAPARPANMPRHPGGRTLWIGLGILGLVLVGFFSLKLLFSEKPEPIADKEDAIPTVEKQEADVRKIPISTEQIDLTAEYVGTTGYQFLEATLSSKTPEHYKLAVRMRCIRPPYGQDVSASSLHIVHGDDEIAPYELDFPFVKANTTGAGVLYFEVPKTWDTADLVLYHGAVNVTKAVVPIRF
ncbi:MAG: hypothetical protein IPM98_08525 [Lewinellaceae bacterium]|nr:hypothetical protein [Lewinellaceae bacterium]